MAARSPGEDKSQRESSGNFDVGSDMEDEDVRPKSRSRQNKPKIEVVMATDALGWNTTTNRLLALALAKDKRLRFRGFVPKDTAGRQTELASQIELLEYENIDGDSPIDHELLDFPPDSLHMDYFIMHSFTPELEKQAERICQARKCKWIHVAHTVSGLDREKIFKDAGIVIRNIHKPVEQKADLVVTIGPKVAEAYRDALRPCGKEANVIGLTPPIFPEFNGVHQIHEHQDKVFVIFMDSSYPGAYFNSKGCDIAIKAFLSLPDMSYHLLFAVRDGGDTSELTKTALDEGIPKNQFTVKPFSHFPKSWATCFDDFYVDVVIMPSRIEGFGLSGLYAISANIPVLVSKHSGLAMALKTLPSGANHVVESDEPQIWAERISAIRAKKPAIRALKAEQLKNEYKDKFNWEDQCNILVERMITEHGK
ncbi:D-inositol 3-phosphate glycosyltransferase-like [Oculina patagonica]